uniref:Uncharacterized protein n=1 Tax=Arundo donax TaxID=35708 RepID=A0A0A8Y384_ARUDO
MQNLRRAERLHIDKAPPIKFDCVLFCSELSVFLFKICARCVYQ